MKRFKVLVAAGITTALTIGTLALPAAAADKGRVIVVNGMSSTQAELCLGKKEIRSTFNYGGKAVIKKAPGAQVIKLRKKSAGKCSGKLLARKVVVLKAGDDRTLVFSRKTPRPVLFPDYTEAGNMVLRNASDIGTTEFRYEYPDGGFAWYKSALSDIEYAKSDWGWGYTASDGVFWARQVSTGKVVANPFNPHPPSGFRHEAILVGTGSWNARWVHVVVKNDV